MIVMNKIISEKTNCYDRLGLGFIIYLVGKASKTGNYVVDRHDTREEK